MVRPNVTILHVPVIPLMTFIELDHQPKSERSLPWRLLQADDRRTHRSIDRLTV
jgi:hypothetical protein